MYALRYSSITVIQSVTFLIKLIVQAVWHMLEHHGSCENHSICGRSFTATNGYIAAFFLYCFVTKFWLLRYNILLNEVLIDSQWKSIIDRQGYIPQHTFWVKYRRTLGNSVVAMRICIVATFLATTSYVVIQFICGNRRWATLYAEFDYVIPLICLIALYCKTPSFNDNFYIRKEMKYVFICLVVMYINYYTSRILEIRLEKLEEETKVKLSNFITTQITVAMQFTAMLFSTFWVNERCAKIIKLRRYDIHKVEEGHCVEIRPKSKKVNKQIQQTPIEYPVESPPSPLITPTSQGTPSSAAMPAPIRMSTIHSDSGMMDTENPSDFDLNIADFGLQESLHSTLADDGLLDLFAKHIWKEFCAECLMSLIEMQQFKSHLGEQLKVKNVKQIVEFAPGVPRSEIVFKEPAPDLDFFKGAAYLLFKKYVEEGSEFEINISSRMRQDLVDMMSDREHWMSKENAMSAKDLSVIFDDAMREMVILLRQSTYRFHDKLDGG